MQRVTCMGCMTDYTGTVCPNCGFDHRAYSHPKQALPMGHTLRGRFYLGRVLGQGGFGITYIAFDTVLRLRVAIKEYFPTGFAGRIPGSTVINWNDARDAAVGREHCIKEARKMAKIQNVPTVVKVRDVFDENDTAYIIMDYVEGRTLRDKLKLEGPMPLQDCTALLAPVMDAMEQVHQNGLIHRDISPDNIMIDRSGVPYVLDLGAAKDLDWSTNNSTQVVKHGFSPPEQYLRTSELGPWMDIYAMTATVYSALTGRVPPSAMERLYRDGLDLSMVPPETARVLAKGMALKREQRYQTMGQLKAALTGIPEQGKQTAGRRSGVLNSLFTGGMSKKYEAALSMLASRRYDEAEAAFQQLGDYRDSPARILECRYLRALLWLESGRTEAAAALLRSLGNYRDSRQRVEDFEKGRLYREAESLEQQNRYAKAAGLFVQLRDYRDSRKRAIHLYAKIGQNISAGEYHTVGLCADGTVLAAGFRDNRCNVAGWTQMAALAAGWDHTAAIRIDGTAVAAGNNEWGQCEIFGWNYLMDVKARMGNTLGLRWDGIVLAAGRNDSGQCNVQHWRDVIEVSPGNDHTIGLKRDGTLLAAGSNVYGQCDVLGWSGIAAVSAGGYHTVGLKEDGTVLAAGANIGYYGKVTNQCEVSGWTDIVAVSAGQFHTVGLKADGTVVAVGWNEDGQCNVSGWRNIVAVAAGTCHTVGLRADGTMVAAGSNAYDRCDVWHWRNLDIPGEGSAASDASARLGDSFSVAGEMR